MNDSEFTADERALLNQAREDHESGTDELPAGDGDGDVSDQQAVNQASEQAAEQTAPQEDAQTTQAERPTGDVRAALRASRRSEDRARREVERLSKEIEALKAGVVAPSQDDDTSVMSDVEADFPQVAQVIKKLTQQVQELSKTQPSQQQRESEPDFVPPSLPPELQSAVDDTPDLLDWQLNPDQTNFELAKQADALLLKSPKWRDATDAKRFAEVVRLVKEQVEPVASPQSNQTNVEAARRVIEGTKRTAPVGISDLRGGSAPTKTEPDYSRLTDEQILSSLPR